MSVAEPGSTTAAERVAQLVDRARTTLDRPATFIARAPGRVNLLGEHTDYNLLPVLPMAIERSVLIAGAPRDDRLVTLRNTGAFPERRFELVERIPKFADGDWGNYAKAAAQGLGDYRGGPLPRGADLLIDGNIPSGAGLSSSSALVVACALALLAANDEDVPYETLAELLPRAERYVGTLSGGMDQTVSLLARGGHALRIDFAPLRCRPVPLPAGYAIVVCHSLVRAEKSGAAKQAYNQRVVECRLACRVLERALRDRLDRPVTALGELARVLPQRPLSSFVDDLAAVLPSTPLELAEIAAFAESSESEMRRVCEIPPEQTGPFTVLTRARHVLTEAMRVDRAEAALHSGDAFAFGALMDASHRSCRDDYEISCTELETLVTLAKDAGATGSRLTGAGFGGCTVSLVERESLQRFIDTLDERFYVPRLDSSRSPNDCRFVFTPQAGAGIERW